MKIKFMVTLSFEVALGRKHSDRLADSRKRSSVNQMAAGSRLQVQVMDFFLLSPTFQTCSVQFS